MSSEPVRLFLDLFRTDGGRVTRALICLPVLLILARAENRWWALLPIGFAFIGWTPKRQP